MGIKRYAAIVVTALTLAGGTASAELPEISPYTAGASISRELDTVSGAKGSISMRGYRTGTGNFWAVLTEGSGPKFFYPHKERFAADGYESFEISGMRAIFERDDLLGSTLVVMIDELTTLTLESGPYGMERADLEAAAIKIIDAMR